MPLWFDEGLAMQNDYREAYDLSSLPKDIDLKQLDFDYDAMADSDYFYSGDADSRHSNYIISKYQVSAWIEKNGKEALIKLLSDIQSGQTFESCYLNQ